MHQRQQVHRIHSPQFVVAAELVTAHISGKMSSRAHISGNMSSRAQISRLVDTSTSFKRRLISVTTSARLQRSIVGESLRGF